MAILKQVGAIAVRNGDNGTLEILLVTSRDTGRWVIPKGWPSKRLSDAGAAAREAKQEAGVTGKMATRPLGAYRYFKASEDGARLVQVVVFLLAVKKERKRWREKVERQRTWFDLKTAARLVREPGLRTLIMSLRKPLR
jgi:8-oxo-dGTP pyrophosphatase MutT (NUDIX family)